MNDQACRACGYVVHKPDCPMGGPIARLREFGCDVELRGDQLSVIEPSGTLHSARVDDREFWAALVVHLEGFTADGGAPC